RQLAQQLLPPGYRPLSPHHLSQGVVALRPTPRLAVQRPPDPPRRTSGWSRWRRCTGRVLCRSSARAFSVHPRMHLGLENSLILVQSERLRIGFGSWSRRGDLSVRSPSDSAHAFLECIRRTLSKRGLG